jgi:hypothetical protein
MPWDPWKHLAQQRQSKHLRYILMVSVPLLSRSTAVAGTIKAWQRFRGDFVLIKQVWHKPA